MGGTGREGALFAPRAKPPLAASKSLKLSVPEALGSLIREVVINTLATKGGVRVTAYHLPSRLTSYWSRAGLGRDETTP